MCQALDGHLIEVKTIELWPECPKGGSDHLMEEEVYWKEFSLTDLFQNFVITGLWFLDAK